MASYQLSARVDGAAVVSSLPIGWNVTVPLRGGGLAPGEPDAVATSVRAVVPSDVTIFNPPCRWLWIGTGGTLAVQMYDGSCFSMTVPDATRLLFSVRQVLSLTTCQNIVACW